MTGSNKKSAKLFRNTGCTCCSARWALVKTFNSKKLPASGPFQLIKPYQVTLESIALTELQTAWNLQYSSTITLMISRSDGNFTQITESYLMQTTECKRAVWPKTSSKQAACSKQQRAKNALFGVTCATNSFYRIVFQKRNTRNMKNYSRARWPQDMPTQESIYVIAECPHRNGGKQCFVCCYANFWEPVASGL